MKCICVSKLVALLFGNNYSSKKYLTIYALLFGMRARSDEFGQGFSEKDQCPLSEVGGPLREVRPSQLITEFHKSVSHNSSMHLIVCLPTCLCTWNNK